MGTQMTPLKLDSLFVCLESKDNTARYNAFQTLLNETEKKVSWIYNKWDILVKKLTDENSFQRSIGVMLLASLAKSDTEKRFSMLIEDYLLRMYDEKFITARQCIQTAWKVAVEDKAWCGKVIAALEQTYYENVHNKTHANLIKLDVLASLNEIFRQTGDKKIHVQILSFIEEENDVKIKKQLQKALLQ